MFKFIKNYCQLLLILLVLIASVSPSQARGIFPAITGSGTVSWANWTEKSESAVASSNLYMMFLESASGNETGQGGSLTGADLVGSESGTLAGCTTTELPPYRIFDGVDDYMLWTATAMNLLSNGTNTWTIIVKCSDMSDAATSDNAMPFYFYDGTNDVLGAFVEANKIKFQVWNGGTQHINSFPTDNLPTTGEVYVAIWSDGTYIRGGWTTSGSGAGGQPTKWSDFPANNRVTATASCTWANGTFTSTTYALMRFDATYTQGKIHYVGMANYSLIDNAN